MPKMKKHSGAQKRFTITGSGKIKRRHANHSHILTKKNTKRKRHLRQSDLLAPSDVKRIRPLIGK